MNKKIVLSIAAIGVLSNAWGIEFKPVGYKAVGMGGAGVASSRGSLAGYYNPAMLRFSDYTTEITLGAGVSIRESNLIDNMDELSDIDFDTTVDNIGSNVENKNLQISASLSGSTLTLSDNTTTNLNNTTVTTLNGIEAGTSEDLTIDSQLYTVTKNSDGTFTLNQDGIDNNIEDISNIQKGIDIITKEISDNNGLSLAVTPNLSLQITDAFALGVYSAIDVNMRINFNPVYDQIIVEGDTDGVYYQYDYNNDTYIASNSVAIKDDYESSSIEYAMDGDNEINYIQVDSQVIAEIPISYAHLFDTSYGSWSIGANLKPMSLTTYSHKVLLGEDSDEADSELEDYETTYDSTLGVDLGIAYRPVDSKITFALVGKNINSPTFKVNESQTGLTEDYKVDPMVRAGISLPIWNDNIEFAFDADLTKNNTSIESEKSQYIGGGLEFHPASWFALRAGAMQDMASERFDDGMIVTGGLGIGLKWLQVDLSLMASTEKGEYDGQEIPRYMAANFSLVSRWGDGYNRKSAPEISKQEKEVINKTLSESEKNRIQNDAQKAQDELNKATN